MTGRGDAFLVAAWWPMALLGEALEALAGRHGLSTLVLGDVPAVPDGDVTDWLGRAGGNMGIEAVAVTALVSDLPELIAHGGPAIVELSVEGLPGFVALCGRRGRRPVFLAPDGRRVACAAEDFAGLLCRAGDARVRPEVERVLGAAQVAAGRRGQVADALVRQRLSGEEVAGITLLRMPAAAPFGAQLRLGGVFGRLAAIVALFVLLYSGEIWGWQLIGGATLEGRQQWGWLLAWVLLLFSMMPWRLLAGWNEAMFALDVGRLVKSRLLAGALALPPDAVKRRGIGQLIGQVMESEALQSLAMGGGFSVLVGVVELGFAAWVLHLGAAPEAHLLALGLFAALTVWLGLAYSKGIAGWTGQRLAMTEYLIEAMVGHRTRLAQEQAGRRDAAEDGQLAAYLGRSAVMDRAGIRLGAGIGTGWMATCLLALVPVLAGPGGATPAALAISLGGIMLAQRAFGGIAGGLASLSRAGFAWRQVGEIFRAGADRGGVGHGAGLGAVDLGAADGPVLEARGMRFGYDGGGGAVIDQADLTIARGDRILIEGPSGGGKSTLAALMTGLRLPDAGVLHLGGLDRPTLGDDWHRHVAAAPQFHENHIFSGTLAFNLLMGREWPAGEAALAEAEALCEELGLGDLLRRMPGGIHQQVGETGWQLSHGERSRIFLARALLQRAEVTVLDESFASLDPATMDRCLRTALDRTSTLVVIAHP